MYKYMYVYMYMYMCMYMQWHNYNLRAPRQNLTTGPCMANIKRELTCEG